MSYKTCIETDIELPYAKMNGQSEIAVEVTDRSESRIAELESEFEAGESQYRREKARKADIRAALKGQRNTAFAGKKHDLVTPVYIISVASIQTPTEKWENSTVEWLNDQISLEEYLKTTQHGGQKWSTVQNVLKTDLLESAAAELRRNHLARAVEYLCGEHHDISTYLRGTKAWMVVRWFYHVPCIDTNVHAAVKPILVNNFDVKRRHHRRTVRMDTDKVSPVEKRWIQERVGRYGEHTEMMTIWNVVDAAVRMMTDIPRDCVAQVAFNVGGRLNNDDWERTTHEPIYDALMDNLDRFE